ncbi:MAG: Rpn family recombination-promoting nuclease/putative transposase [Minicystis sp.]
MQPPNPHDALVKFVFGNPEHAAGELRHILRPQLAARIDWSTLLLCSGSFVDEALRGRHSDLLFTARCGDKQVLVYLLFEHQSTGDPLMAFRLLLYMVRIWEQHLRANPKATRLPAILPVVLHHSERGWTSPTSFEALIDLDEDTLPLVAENLPRFTLLLDDISAERDEALRGRAMTALARLALFCLRHAREPAELVDALGRWIDLVREVRAAPGGGEALARIWRYIFVVSNPAQPEDLVKRLVGVVGKGSKEDVMTVAEWLREEGSKESLRKTLLKLLRARFGEVPEGAVARIQAAGSAQLDAWLDRFVGAATVDDVLADA